MASSVKFLLGTFLGVWARTWVGVGGRFGSGFLSVGLVSSRRGRVLVFFFLVDVANPWCLTSIRFLSTFTNICWFQSGWGFGFLGLVLGLGAWFWFSRFNLGVLIASGFGFWGLLFRLGV